MTEKRDALWIAKCINRSVPRVNFKSQESLKQPNMTRYRANIPLGLWNLISGQVLGLENTTTAGPTKTWLNSAENTRLLASFCSTEVRFEQSSLEQQKINKRKQTVWLDRPHKLRLKQCRALVNSWATAAAGSSSWHAAVVTDMLSIWKVIFSVPG